MAEPLLGMRYAGGEYVQAIKPSGSTVALDLLVAASRSSGSLNEGLYLVTNTVFCHFKFGDNTIAADATCALLAPGERLLYLPNLYISVIKSAGASDGIIRITQAI